MNITITELKEKALDLGWDDIGITSPTIPEEDISAYRVWLSNGFHGDMQYMENQLRCTPQELLPGAITAIIFVTYYKQPTQLLEENKGLIASYARGKDYHKVHQKLLKLIRYCFITFLNKNSNQNITTEQDNQDSQDNQD